ncbi:MAG: sigma-70 family RNA polymerase sigma factor [bacterium]|nr:sigma-70 family RNA polymerase sigma factor [bacterium]
MTATLIARARAGDPEAECELVQTNAAQLRRYLDRRMGSHMRRTVSAADLGQEIFARVFAALKTMPTGADARTFRRWLYRHADWVLSNHGNAARHWRGESAAGARSDVAEPQPSAGAVTRGDEAAWLHALVERLPGRYADVVRLRLAGLAFAEIANRLGIREETARQRHARVLRTLRDQTDESVD